MTLLLHTDEAFDKVRAEFARQEAKYGYQYHTTAEWAMITSEEFGEAIKSTNDKNLVSLTEELIDTIACALHWYDEARRQQKNITDGTYTEVNTLSNGYHTSEQQTLEHLANHPPFQDFSIVVPDKPVRITYEHGTFDITPDNMFVKGVD